MHFQLRIQGHLDLSTATLVTRFVDNLSTLIISVKMITFTLDL